MRDTRSIVAVATGDREREPSQTGAKACHPRLAVAFRACIMTLVTVQAAVESTDPHHGACHVVLTQEEILHDAARRILAGQEEFARHLPPPRRADYATAVHWPAPLRDAPARALAS